MKLSCHRVVVLPHYTAIFYFQLSVIYLHILELVWKVLVVRGSRKDYCYTSGKGGKKRKVPSQMFFS